MRYYIWILIAWIADIRMVIGLFGLIVILWYHIWWKINKKANKIEEKSPRSLILLCTVFIEISFICFFWQEIEQFITIGSRPELLKGLLPILMAAIPAYLLWHWRNQDKQKSLEQAQWDLKQKDTDIKIKENNDAWDNFIKYQKMAEDKNNEHSESTRAAAIYALGEYYGRTGTEFPNQVHVFFKNFLDDFWNNDLKPYHEYIEALNTYNQAAHAYTLAMEECNNTKNYLIKRDQLLRKLGTLENIKLPEYIKAVHRVFVIKSNDKKLKDLFHEKNDLNFAYFNLTNANLQKTNFSGAQLSATNLTNARFNEANLANAKLNGANLIGAQFNNANLINTKFVHANLTNAFLVEANLTNALFLDANLTGTSFLGANLNGTRFFEANLYSAELADTKLNSVFNHVNLTKAKFFAANLTEAELKDVNLTEAQYDGETRFPQDFDPEQAGMIKPSSIKPSNSF